MIGLPRTLQRCAQLRPLSWNSRTIVTTTADMCHQKAHAAAAGRKPKESPKITLVAQNNNISVTSLSEAQKLAKRRDLFLVQLQQLDAKTQRPLYKLATAAEMLSHDAEESDAGEKPAADKVKSLHKKSEKSLTIGCRISEHDLTSRLKNITKWLTKGHEVRILIQSHSEGMPNSEKIVKDIERTIKEPELIGKIVQKRTKGTIIKFSVMPVPRPCTGGSVSSPAA